MKINKSRKSTHTIMAHGDGKASMTVIRIVNDVEVKYTVPSEHIFDMSRTMKKYGVLAMNEFFMNIVDKIQTEVQA